MNTPIRISDKHQRDSGRLPHRRHAVDESKLDLRNHCIWARVLDSKEAEGKGTEQACGQLRLLVQRQAAVSQHRVASPAPGRTCFRFSIRTSQFSSTEDSTGASRARFCSKSIGRKV